MGPDGTEISACCKLNRLVLRPTPGSQVFLAVFRPSATMARHGTRPSPLSYPNFVVQAHKAKSPSGHSHRLAATRVRKHWPGFGGYWRMWCNPERNMQPDDQAFAIEMQNRNCALSGSPGRLSDLKESGEICSRPSLLRCDSSSPTGCQGPTEDFLTPLKKLKR